MFSKVNSYENMNLIFFIIKSAEKISWDLASKEKKKRSSEFLLLMSKRPVQIVESFRTDLLNRLEQLMIRCTVNVASISCFEQPLISRGIVAARIS